MASASRESHRNKLLEASVKDDPRAICRKVHDAVSRGAAQESLALLWALQDSAPRWAAVRPVADESYGVPPRTLLQSFAAAGFDTPLKKLLDLGVSVQQKDEDGKTALHLATEQNNIKIVKLLLKFGRARVDARDAMGRTPLHIAAASNLKKVSTLLMNFGADPRSEDAVDETALDVARRAVRGKKGKLQDMMHNSIEKQSKGRGQVARVLRKKTAMAVGGYGQAAGETPKAMLPADVVAPKLVMTAVGYCPLDGDGEVIQLKRGIRFAKRRQAPSSPKGYVNWYSPRG